MNQIRGRITEINKKADVLLDGLSPDIQGFVNNKLPETLLPRNVACSAAWTIWRRFRTSPSTPTTSCVKE